MDINKLVTAIPHLTLNSDRLVLRKINASDFDAMVAHEQDSELMKYIRPITSLAETKKKVRQCIDKWDGKEGQWLMLVVHLNSDNKHIDNNNELIGMVCLNFESLAFKRVEIGYRFHHNFQGKGYAFEAVKEVVNFLFNEVKIHKLLAYCVAEHHASFKLMEKLGMKREACLRQHSKLADDKWHDELIYGLLATEYNL